MKKRFQIILGMLAFIIVAKSENANAQDRIERPICICECIGNASSNYNDVLRMVELPIPVERMSDGASAWAACGAYNDTKCSSDNGPGELENCEATVKGPND